MTGLRQTWSRSIPKMLDGGVAERVLEMAGA
jgi:hypothetical protein